MENSSAYIFTKDVFTMIVVGIDISKYKHDCCIIDSNGIIFREPFSYANNAEGLTLFLEVLNSLSDSNSIRIGAEAIAHYALSLKLFLEKTTILSWNSHLCFLLSSTSIRSSEKPKRMQSLILYCPLVRCGRVQIPYK